MAVQVLGRLGDPCGMDEKIGKIDGAFGSSAPKE
jgi:hypothetical protein